MSKSIFRATLAATGLLATAILPASAAFAESDNAAAVVKGETCTGFITTADGKVESLITTNKGAHRVVTSSGVAILSCQFRIPRSEAPSRVRTARGFRCTVDGEPTTDTRMLVNPGGRALLVCKINGQ